MLYCFILIVLTLPFRCVDCQDKNNLFFMALRKYQKLNKIAGGLQEIQHGGFNWYYFFIEIGIILK